MKKVLCYYPKVSKKADKFALREYETDGYERQWLSKGYYHGFVEGVKAMYRLLRLKNKVQDPFFLTKVLGNHKELKVCD